MTIYTNCVNLTTGIGLFYSCNVSVELGDGRVSPPIGIVTTHCYESCGTFIIYVVVDCGDNCWGADSTMIIDLFVSDVNICEGDTVNFEVTVMQTLSNIGTILLLFL